MSTHVDGVFKPEGGDKTARINWEETKLQLFKETAAGEREAKMS